MTCRICYNKYGCSRPWIDWLAQMIATEGMATEFAREHGLLLSENLMDVVNYGVGDNSHKCAMGTFGCSGYVNQHRKRKQGAIKYMRVNSLKFSGANKS